MAKSPDAFRTIGEVSDALDTPQHVLRFWESKFTQVKPVKRAGGRRYYRPDDMSLLAGIRELLHGQGMTIKGAQKILRDQGVKHVTRIGEGTFDLRDDGLSVTDGGVSVDTVTPTHGDADRPDRDGCDAVSFDRQGPAEDPATSEGSRAAPSTADAPPSGADAHDRPALLALSARMDPARLRRDAATLGPLLIRLEAVCRRLTDGG